MPVTLISPDDSYRLAQSGAAVIVDVREPVEFAARRIDGAALASAASLTPEFARSAGKLILYCSSGRRSLQVAQALAEKAPDLTIASLDGGVKAWKKAGLPMVENPAVISIERQTQIAAGSIVLAGTLLGVFVNAGFLLVPAFVGSGLIFAGLSGTCGLAWVLAKLPWNVKAGETCGAACVKH